MPFILNPLSGNFDYYQSVGVGGTISGGTEGSVLFVGSGGVLSQDNASLFFDDTNNRLGIGTNSPQSGLHVYGTGSGRVIRVTGTDVGGGDPAIILESSAGASTWSMQVLGSGSDQLRFRHVSTGDVLTLGATGNVLVNGFTASTVGLTVKGAASQSAKLTEWQNSSGTVLASVASDGSIQVGTYGTSAAPAIRINEAAGRGIYGANGALAFTNGSGEVYLSPASTGRGVLVQNSGLIGWSSNSSAIGPQDAAFARNAAGVVEVNNGTAGQWAALRCGSPAAATIGVVVKGAAAQSANLQEWQNSGGAALARVSNFGSVVSTGHAVYVGGLSGTLVSECGFNTNGTINIAYNASTVPVTIKGAASQSANLQEWQDSSGTVLASVTKDGYMRFGASAYGQISGGAGAEMVFSVSGSTNAMRIATDGKVGVGPGLATPDSPFHVENRVGTSGSTVTQVFRVTNTLASGNPSAGYGVGMEFELRNNGGAVDKVAGTIESLWTDPTNGSEDADLVFKTVSGGTLAERVRVKDTGNVVLTAHLERSVQTGITASTTQTQGQGALTKDQNYVSTVANENDTCTLPSAVAGLDIYVRNGGANTLQIFPASGDAIDGDSVNASTFLPAGSSVRLVAADSTDWYS